MLTLIEKDLQELNNYIQELPVKHGLPLLNFLNSKIAEQKKAAEEKQSEKTDITK
jgi:hypothetical protein